MQKAELSYHHGDLRNALISKATEIIEQDGLQAVSLRKIGTALGVSQAAMYSHFSNKLALLEAVAVKSYEQLINRQTEALAQSNQFMSKVLCQGEAYVLFAKQHPHLYQLMFGQLFMDSQKCPNLKLMRKRSFNLLQSVFNEAYDNGQYTRDPHIAAVAGRVLVHGIASMVIDGTISPSKKLDEEEEQDLIRQLLQYFSGGI